MNRFLKFFVRLYPAAWRNRYEAELTALLEDLNLSWKTSLDVLKGALAMQLRTLSLSRIVIITGVAGLLLGLSARWFIPNQYVSTALLHMDVGPEVPRELYIERVTSISRNALSRSRLTTLIQRYDLYHEQLKRAPYADVLAEMKENIRLSPGSLRGPKNLVKIEFSYRDPALAQQVVQDLTELFISPPFDVPGPGGEILVPASRPTNPISPNWVPLAIIGVLVGVLIGVLLVLFLRRTPKPA